MRKVEHIDTFPADESMEDECDDIKIEMEELENTVCVDPGEVLVHELKKEPPGSDHKRGDTLLN